MELTIQQAILATRRIRKRPVLDDLKKGDLSKVVKRQVDVDLKYNGKMFSESYVDVFTCLLQDACKLVVIKSTEPTFELMISDVCILSPMPIECIICLWGVYTDDGKHRIRLDDVINILRRYCSYEIVGYYPGQYVVPSNTYNCWKGWNTSISHEIDDGSKCLELHLYDDCQFILDHILYVACDDRRDIYIWLMCWIGAIISGIKPGTYVIFCGDNKDNRYLISEYLRGVLGLEYSDVTHWADVDRRYNYQTACKSLIVLKYLPKALDCYSDVVYINDNTPPVSDGEDEVAPVTRTSIATTADEVEDMNTINTRDYDRFIQKATRTTATYEMYEVGSFEMNDCASYIFMSPDSREVKREHGDEHGTLFEFNDLWIHDQCRPPMNIRQAKESYLKEAERHLNGDLQEQSMKSFALFATRVYRHCCVTSKQVDVTRNAYYQ